MKRTFRTIRSDRPEHAWPALFRSLWPAYRRWYSRHGLSARPTFLACENAMRRHMPEIVPVYESLVQLAGGDDLSARFLSLYGPGPFLTGCSQACRTGARPLLIRNYDYDPLLWDGVFMCSRWQDRTVMAMIDCAWGVLDGINDSGLVTALAFGGRRVMGDGFGAPIILRYVLETCDTTADAVDCLRRVPSHMAYNVTLLDRAGDARTVFIAPDREATVLDRACSSNHQTGIEWPEYERATRSIERQQRLEALVADPRIEEQTLLTAFFEPPLRATHFDAGWGTLYTAVYDPLEGRARFVWPDRSISVCESDFVETAVELEFGEIA